MSILKNKMNHRSLIQESLQILSLISLNPFSLTLINHFYKRIICVIEIGALMDVILYLSFNYQGSESTMEVLIIVGFTQITMKMFVFLTYKNELILLIKNTSTFGKSNIYEFEQQEENEKIVSFVKFSVRFYIALLMIISMCYFIKPLFLDEAIELPWKSCCSQFLTYNVCYVLQVLQAPTILLTALGFDMLYISLITNITCEFKLVKNRFATIKINPTVNGTDKEALVQLKDLINHHNLILKCIKIMKKILRYPMLGLFSSNMFGMCFALIIMTSSTSNTTNKLLFGMVTIFYLVQLFFYCICGSMLADESVQISAEVYKSKWWIKTQPELRKALIMIIQRANKPEILTAGGLLQVNLPTFTTILRSTVSFFTFIQVIYGNS